MNKNQTLLSLITIIVVTVTLGLWNNSMKPIYHLSVSNLKVQGLVYAQDDKASVEASSSSVSESKTVEDGPTPANDTRYGDAWVAEYTDHYFTDGPRRSEVRMIMHCLLNREAGHGQGKGFGDGGLAGGPLQYHQSTWDGFRQIMLQRGLISEIGSRLDLKQAIHTTIWAIADGRAMNWGPILRRSEGIDRADCPVPSWY